ncbi:MAG: glucose-6-phosphate dehydrogenase assembly protein OpcA [Verrucomicrobiota bacterium]
MGKLIDSLPGIELPVSEVTKRLATMWEGEMSSSLSEFRASQMNVVLHFGVAVSVEEASERFETVIRFAQRYPSRIIVLCPELDRKDSSMTAKLFSQCYIGESHREMCCCEALLLGYESEDFGFLANQVSVWLEGDLPTYHWFNRVSSDRIKKYYDSLLVGVRRIVFDSSIENEDVYGLDWPEPEKVVDLARARLLPVRQALGQYLSGYSVEALAGGLQKVTVRHGETSSGEGAHLMAWLKSSLIDCANVAAVPSDTIEFALASSGADENCALCVEFTYEDERFLRWGKTTGTSICEIEAQFGGKPEKVPTRIKSPAADQALSEALFF